jgi:hypothetical protein
MPDFRLARRRAALLLGASLLAACSSTPPTAPGWWTAISAFFHGPGMSKQAQYIAKLYGADDYVITDMEAAAVTLVIQRTHGIDRVMSCAAR